MSLFANHNAVGSALTFAMSCPTRCRRTACLHIHSFPPVPILPAYCPRAHKGRVTANGAVEEAPGPASAVLRCVTMPTPARLHSLVYGPRNYSNAAHAVLVCRLVRPCSIRAESSLFKVRSGSSVACQQVDETQGCCSALRTYLVSSNVSLVSSS